MDESTWGPVRELLARTATDADLRDRVMADPLAAIEAETGAALPDDWRLVGTLSATGAVELAFADDELPLDYLAVVGGGVSNSYSFPPYVGGPGDPGNPFVYPRR